MTLDSIVILLTPLLPTLCLLLGGQRILNQYEHKRKKKEQEIELLRTVREKRYQAVESLYHLFAVFMALYREIDRPETDLSDEGVRNALLKRATEAEAEVDALILRIGCEFVHKPEAGLEALLGNLRQAVQHWREVLEHHKRLEFYYSDHPDYVRFKETFARTAAFMVHHIHEQLEPSLMRQEQAASILIGVFNNRYEFAHYQPIQKPNG